MNAENMIVELAAGEGFEFVLDLADLADEMGFEYREVMDALIALNGVRKIRLAEVEPGERGVIRVWAA